MGKMPYIVRGSIVLLTKERFGSWPHLLFYMLILKPYGKLLFFEFCWTYYGEFKRSKKIPCSLLHLCSFKGLIRDAKEDLQHMAQVIFPNTLCGFLEEQQCPGL
ncbi:Pyridoxal-phosphate-dependent serine hydroxymethyltransferase [Gossypium arboreum]|uniref:Pyridoxal-phosphate-dependent serine hydroxymethyltransferase n=1 Tax=Gossypium arboreum TaxID=29729 RepID=A0A0B0MCI7_GOSAR|nr:Pyridoxal-phosphate-dependent serine hydroxymethyltransferase [Gossypium arboreum]